ncbi:hypothetical protein VNI00_004586 [Paramarasmius palmivorus]|uniref:F-box domain-containing protein n=1 Tax=Paramarasmius palmivorus TaxID=297713 RepID=A0AAW0DI29_9AGAR
MHTTHIHQFPLVADELLRSNQVPSPPEQQQICSYIEMEERTLTQYDQEIARLRDVLAQLKIQRQALYTRTQRRRSQISPIRRLPNEILEEVLSMICMREFGLGHSLHILLADDESKSQTVTATTLNLTHVSFHWRQVVKASARLWSSIRIAFTANTRHLVYGDILKLYLSQAKEHPLDLRLIRHPSTQHFHPPVFIYYYQVAPAILDILSPHFPHIEKLEIHSNILNSQSLYYPSTAFSSLYSFTSGRGSNNFPSWVWSILGTAPRLAHVDIDTLPGRDKLPYPRLTSLTVESVDSRRELLTTLGLCTNLRSLRFGVHVRYGFDDPQETSVKLASLRHLSITSHRENVLFDFLRQLTTPMLEQLEIEVGQKPSAPLAPFIGLISRSGCHLKDFVLSIPRIHCSDAELQEFLALCPELSRFEADINDSGFGVQKGRKTFTYRLFDVLRASSDNLTQWTILSPNVVEIKINEECRISKETLSSLLDMIESRDESCRLAALGNVNEPLRRRVTRLDLRFGELVAEYPTEAMAGLKHRVESLAKKSIRCYIDILQKTLDSTDSEG